MRWEVYPCSAFLEISVNWFWIFVRSMRNAEHWMLMRRPFGVCLLFVQEERNSKCAVAFVRATATFLYSFLRVKSFSPTLGSVSSGSSSNFWLGVSREEFRMSSSSSMRKLSSYSIASSGVGGMVIVELVAGGLSFTWGANPLMAALWGVELGLVGVSLAFRAVPLPSSS